MRNPCALDNAALSTSRFEPVSKMGGAGEPPAPVGDPPTGTAAGNVAKRPCHLARAVAPFQSGESPDYTGGSPLLPPGDSPITRLGRKRECRASSLVPEGWMARSLGCVWGLVISLGSFAQSEEKSATIITADQPGRGRFTSFACHGRAAGFNSIQCTPWGKRSDWPPWRTRRRLQIR